MPQDKESKLITEYATTIAMRPTKNWQRTAPLTGTQFAVERGRDPSVLVVAFTGFAGKLSLPTFDFLRSTELLDYSRILLCDNSRTCYLNGIPPVADDVGALRALLERQITELAPERTLFIGSSGGSHAAILFGHMLGADYVHAFSPHTNIDPAFWRASEAAEDREAFADTLAKLDRVPQAARAYFDLSRVLAESNGRTLYNLHFCARSAPDLARAVRVEGLPGVTLHRHDCAHHRVVVWLAGQRRLLPLLKLENQQAFAAGATV